MRLFRRGLIARMGLLVSVGLAAAAVLTVVRLSGDGAMLPVAMRQPAEGQPGERRGPGGAGGERRASVEGSMKAMERALEPLYRQFEEAGKREENLRLVNDAQRGCVQAKGLGVPRSLLAKKATEAEKAALTETYRADLIATLRRLLDLEEAIASGNADAAKVAIAELKKLREQGHHGMGLHE